MGQGTMSEPMSSGEIEDVLSSIRRLVSEDLRPSAAHLGAAKAPAAGKLLLTPALRVVSSTPEVPARMQPAKPQPAPNEDILPEGEATADTPQDWIPEASTGSHETSWEQSDVTRVVSEIGAAVADSDEEWEPEAGDASMATVSWQAPEWVEEAEVVEDSVEAAERDAVARAFAEKAEAAAVAEIMARAAQAKAEDEAVKAKGQAADPDLFAEDEGYFDETVLRDLVRDLIREELSGTLGERITRNVRKLVRAEINRALTARDFD